MLKPNPFYCLVAAALLAIAAVPAAAQEATPPDPEAALATLQSDAEYTERLQAYRALRQSATAEAIPTVAEALHDPKESHLARYVLEAMPQPEAVAALRAALEGAPEAVLPGLLASLGVRRDADAVAQITPLINHENTTVAEAATAALGRIASDDAVAALLEAREANPGHVAVLEGLLAAAQQWTEDGKQEEAADLYRVLREPGNPEFVRTGAFFGLAKATPEKTPGRVLKAIQGKDPLYRNLAREVVAQTRGKEATAAYADALPDLPDGAKVSLLAGLARRGDTAAREGVIALASSNNPAVQVAAVEALGALGNASDVPLLAELLAEDNEELATAARNSLIRLHGPAVDNRIVKTLADVTPPVRAALLELLAVRIAPQAVPQAKKHLDDDAGVVRLAALRVLQQQGSVAELEAVITLMESNPPEEEAALAARTLGAIAGAAGEEAVPALLDRLPEATEEVQIALVEALGRIGGAKALEPVQAQLDTDDAAMQKAVLSVLEDWPSQDAAPVLLELAKSDDPARHDAGLQGYTRLAQNHPDHDKKNSMMATALDLARSKEDKWMVLSAYGNVHSGPAMDALEAQLDDPEVQKEAAMALLKVSEGVRKHGEGGKARVRKSMELLKEKAPTDFIQEQAEKMLAKIQ